MFISANIKETREKINSILQIDKNFDIINRNLIIAGRDSALFYIDGFAKDAVMEKILEFILSAPTDDVSKMKTMTDFTNKYMPYLEITITSKIDKIITNILSGAIVLCIDNFSESVIIDARSYPARSVEEPDKDKVLRGSKDGFVETIIFNTSLIRRRIRDVNLRIEYFSVGTESKTDIALCYHTKKVDLEFLSKIQNKISKIDIPALTMAQESLAECLIKTRWFNPFPKIRYTERPDAAAASILEGSIIVIIDNSPAIMILPTSIFEFLQDTNDYYFPPFTGTYLRITRIIIFLLTLFATPVWLLMIKNPDFIPEWLDFIKIKNPNTIPPLIQLLILEFAIDGLKLASLNTPSTLNNSLSIIGGLILSEFAIKAGWFIPETILYMAFVAIANFTQPSYELGYAFKFMRIMLLILTGIFNILGFVSGIILMILFVFMNKTVAGKSYLYPLIPFDKKAISNLLIRKKIKNKK